MLKKNYQRKSLNREQKRRIGLANSITLKGKKLSEIQKKGENLVLKEIKDLFLLFVLD